MSLLNQIKSNELYLCSTISWRSYFRTLFTPSRSKPRPHTPIVSTRSKHYAGKEKLPFRREKPRAEPSLNNGWQVSHQNKRKGGWHGGGVEHSRTSVHHTQKTECLLPVGNSLKLPVGARLKCPFQSQLGGKPEHNFSRGRPLGSFFVLLLVWKMSSSSGKAAVSAVSASSFFFFGFWGPLAAFVSRSWPIIDCLKTQILDFQNGPC